MNITWLTYKVTWLNPALNYKGDIYFHRGILQLSQILFKVYYKAFYEAQFTISPTLKLKLY